MINANYNITKIEGALWNALVGGNVITGDKLFMGSRPSSTTATSFIVAGLATDVMDKNAYGTYRMFVDIYAKDLGDGRKDAATLGTLTDKLFAVLPYKATPFYIDFYSAFALDDGMGYHINKIYLDCIVAQQ